MRFVWGRVVCSHRLRRREGEGFHRVWMSTFLCPTSSAMNEVDGRPETID